MKKKIHNPSQYSADGELITTVYSNKFGGWETLNLAALIRANTFVKSPFAFSGVNPQLN